MTTNVLIYIIIIAVIICVCWRLLSNRVSLPCPAWLGWLVELDNPIFRDNRAKVIISHLDIQPGMKILDFGCGPGRLTIPIARIIGPSSNVTAFDIQEAMLERVRTKAANEHLGNIETVRGDAGIIKLGTNQYDRALLVTVLGEVPDKKSLLKEIFNSLKPGGILCVTETIADPHFQTRKTVQSLASEAGLVAINFFGSRVSFSMTFRKP
jgi:ubiquinone/menaquinone biosynthesis C-methylase UbiE